MLVNALITGAILVFIYVVTRGFVHTDFVDRLTQQSSLEVLHYASPKVKDVMPAGSFSLVNPSTSIYSKDRKLLYRKGSYEIPNTWINFLVDNTIFNAERNEYTTVGRRHIVDGQLYLVFISDKDLPGERELTFLFRAIIGGWVVSLVLSYLSGLYFANNALRPVTRVVSEVKQITEDNLSYRLHVEKDASSIDEIDELVLTFNALLSRIEKAFRSQRRFVQNASHELKTPLTAIMAEVELALTRDRNAEEYQRTLTVVMQETERLATITQGLLTLARLEERSPDSEMERVPMIDLAGRTLSAFHLHHPDRAVLQDGEVPNVIVLGSGHLLQIALLNVLDNAFKYSSQPIRVSFNRKGKDVVIGIRDYGIGIPTVDLQRIRSPLFRASNVSRVPGAGLGLALVDRIIGVHKGAMEISSKEGEGTLCLVKLPVVD
jgi:signal transduction histidine kinase